MNIQTTPFGHVLREIRRELSLSQSALSLQLATTQRHISFLETGRSQPTRAMVGRLATGLRLNSAQRAALFEASGLRNPYAKRQITAPDLAAALDLIENRILVHWPFPAFAMDRDWNVLRSNMPGQKMLSVFDLVSGSDGNPSAPNLLEMMLSPGFMAMIENWTEARTAFYFRLISAAANSEKIAGILAAARESGVFDGISDTLSSTAELPVYIPLILIPAPGLRMQLTSLVGQLASVHDPLIEGIEVEFLVPVDDQSEAMMRRMVG